MLHKCITDVMKMLNENFLFIGLLQGFELSIIFVMRYLFSLYCFLCAFRNLRLVSNFRHHI